MKMISIFLLFFFLNISCAYHDTNDSLEWFSKKEKGTAHNIKGVWCLDPNSDKLQISTLELSQDKEKLSGQCGIYNVYGKITSHSIYLHLIAEDRIKYTLKLEFSEIEEIKKLRGKIINYLPIEDEEYIFGNSISFTFVSPSLKPKTELKVEKKIKNQPHSEKSPISQSPM